MRTTIVCLFLLSLLPARGADWKLVWGDEFDKPGLPDPAKWGYEEGFVRNHEKQYYTRGRPENARVENGMLVLEARKEHFKNPHAGAGAASNRRGSAPEFAEYTSASLTTKGKASWRYGRIEVRAKLPSARGTWPAIWMLGTNINEVGWPNCGELDIMEFVGFDPEIVHANVHTGTFNHKRGNGRGGKVKVPDAGQAFHVYALEWSPEKLDFYVDKNLYFTCPNDKGGEGSWPFDKDQYLILNLAIGGDWGGAHGIDEASFPQKYYIDYVRVYQKTP